MKTKELDALDLGLTISLSEKDEERMQLVYTSQLYGTFFCVFGSFDIDRGNPDLLKVKGAYLKLINYKGMINLGIVGVGNPVVTDKGIEVNIEVKALEESDVLKYYGFDQAVPVKNGSPFYFRRRVKPLHVNEQTGLNGQYIHDTEFYERDGLYNRKRTLRLDEDTNPNSWDFNDEKSRWYRTPEVIQSEKNGINVASAFFQGELVKIVPPKKLVAKAPGGRCPKSKSIANY